MATDLSSLSPRRSARLLRLGLYATSQQPPRHLTAPRERARTGALGGKPFLFSERDARWADLAQMPTRPNSFMRRSARLGSQSGSQSGFRSVFRSVFCFGVSLELSYACVQLPSCRRRTKTIAVGPPAGGPPRRPLMRSGPSRIWPAAQRCFTPWTDPDPGSRHRRRINAAAREDRAFHGGLLFRLVRAGRAVLGSGWDGADSH